MNYDFKYISPLERKSFRERLTSLLSQLIFSLYQNGLFQRLKLDKNSFIKSHVAMGTRQKLPRLTATKIPSDPNLKLYSISLLDCIENEDSSRLKSRLIKVVSKYSGGFLSQEPSKKLSQAFDKFDSAYKSISFGDIFFNQTRENEELDLIDGISYSYVKGAQSHFIINYTLYPSEKFHSLFKQSLKSEIIEESEINFRSFRYMLKTKKVLSSINYNVKNYGYWTEKLFNEINFQAKNHIIKDIKLGVFNKHKDSLFPRVLAFEYDPIEFDTYGEEFLDMIGVKRNEIYTVDDIILTLNNADYSKPSPNSLEMFIPHKTEFEKEKDPFQSVSYLSAHYISAIAPYWLLINFSSLNKKRIIDLRKRTFLYIRKNQVTTFLSNAIRIRNKLSMNWIGFERIRKDFSSDVFQRHLSLQGVPDATNKPPIIGMEAQEFKAALVSYSVHISKDIKGSYEELMELFKHISEDNSIRANMRLQRLLFIIAILGVLLSIYGANSSWCNSWIEYYLNDLEIFIPKVPSK